jgi:parvulin-like peptidyl-prolyl isomerase
MTLRTAAAAFACLLFACSAGASVVDQVAAVVDGQVITRSELDEFTANRNRAGAAMKAVSHQEALDVLIENALIEKEASRSGVSVSEEDVQAALADIRSRNSLDDEGFRRALAAQGIAYEAYRSDLRGQILRAKVAGPILRSRLEAGDEAKLQEFYLKHVSEFLEPERVTLARVELPSERAAAEAARGRIAAGLDPRQAPEAKGYQEMGTLSVDSLSEVVRSAVLDLPVGGVSQVVELAGTSHVFILKERQRGRVPAYEEVASRVRERYFAEKEEELYQTWLDSLRERARIERKL